jgi:ATP-dependent helicase HepA
VVAVALPDGRIRLADGRELRSADLWPLDLEGSPFERLARGEAHSTADFANRLAALRLLELREASGLGSFLGGRIRLYPHQLHVAERATRQDPVRWLLSDEVGMGKTIEACLILNRLVRTGRVERCLVVAPDTLTVQWLGELWRKYHQVFTLLDEDRLGDVAKDFGADFNPFDVHRRAVVSLEALVARPRLTDQAVAAGIDLLVVDEAQRLRRRPGHAGDPSWRAVAPIAALGRHVLLLSATPLEDDAHGFFRLLQLLRPEEFPEGTSFEERLASGEPLPPCTSSTRRADIGGLPPRQAVAVDLDEAPDSGPRRELLALLRSAPAPHMLARRQKADRVVRALASGAALSAVLSSDEKGLGAKAAEADARDPRLAWLVARGRHWKQAGDKTLVFVAHR